MSKTLSKTRKTWTDSELDTLRQYYSRYPSGWVGWEVVLPGRCAGSRRAKATQLGLEAHSVTRKWTLREFVTLRDHYPEHGASWDGWKELLPGRTTAQIMAKAQREGVRRYETWPMEDVKTIVLLAAEMERRTGHRASACCSKAYAVLRDYEKKQERV